MTFLELYKTGDTSKWDTDKNNMHNYISEYYDRVLSPLKDEPIRILEIGNFRYGFIKLCQEFFSKAEIYGIERYPDFLHPDFTNENSKNNIHFNMDDVNNVRNNVTNKISMNNTTLYVCDAYSVETLNLFEDNFFDIIIDDGSHAENHQLFCVTHWLNKIKPTGRLVIEDIINHDSLVLFKDSAKNVKEVNIYDLRYGIYNYDNVIFEIIK